MRLGDSLRYKHNQDVRCRAVRLDGVKVLGAGFNDFRAHNSPHENDGPWRSNTQENMSYSCRGGLWKWRHVPRRQLIGRVCGNLSSVR